MSLFRAGKLGNLGCDYLLEYSVFICCSRFYYQAGWVSCSFIYYRRGDDLPGGDLAQSRKAKHNSVCFNMSLGCLASHVVYDRVEAAAVYYIFIFSL